MERFDLTALIQGIIQSSKILAEQAGAEIIFRQSDPIYVWGDEFKVEEVLTNYVTNAIHHVKYDKKIDIRLRLPGGNRKNSGILILAMPSRKKIWKKSGSSFIKWTRREPENMGEAESVFPL